MIRGEEPGRELATGDAEMALIPPGEIIDSRYRILGVLGQGGMGSVYRAEHVTIRRPLAIKLLHPFVSQLSDSARRFEREAFAAGQVDHPNCVNVSDFGKLPDGRLYLVMELLEGISLRQLLDQGPLPPARAVPIVRHVLRALGHAHKLGIVHRDIKPDNVILVERDGEKDFAKVLDFGIALLRSERGSAQLTQVGMTIGTPTYLSPEQALGQTVDHRTDLYAVSIMLFEMLAGRPPFEAAEPLGVLTMHATVEPPRIRTLAPHVPPAIEEALLRGMAKSREQRVQSADEYLALLDTPLPEVTPTPSPAPGMPLAAVALAPTLAVATPGPFPAPITSPLARPRPWVRRAVTIAVTAIVLLIGVKALLPNREERFLKQLSILEKGETCEQRRQAIFKLRTFNDKRAIASIRKARFRMSGGLLGIGGTNENACLREDAEQAIQYLETLR